MIFVGPKLGKTGSIASNTTGWVANGVARPIKVVMGGS